MKIKCKVANGKFFHFKDKRKVTRNEIISNNSMLLKQVRRLEKQVDILKNFIFESRSSGFSFSDSTTVLENIEKIGATNEN